MKNNSERLKEGVVLGGGNPSDKDTSSKPEEERRQLNVTKRRSHGDRNSHILENCNLTS